MTGSASDAIAAIRARSAVVDALYAVAAGSRDADTLEDALLAFGQSANATEGEATWAFLELVASLTHAIRWIDARWKAEPESSRHADAARLRAQAVTAQRDEAWPMDLLTACDLLTALSDDQTPVAAASALRSVPLPPRVTKLFRAEAGAAHEAFDHDEQVATPSVALLARYNGEPVMRPTVLRPGAMHQLSVEARVSEWPSDELRVTFLSVLPRDFLYVSDLVFTPDALIQPLEVRIAGERPPNDPPLGLTAQAHFAGESERASARLIGNTTLELVTFDPGTATPLNMPTAALRLQEMMGEVANAVPLMHADDHRDVRLLLDGVLRFAHTVLDDRLDRDDVVDEAWFQSQLRSFLQADPAIGARLAERIGRAGGTTDLSLGNIVLELKIETMKPISLARATKKYAAQATQYASAGDSQVSLLAVLDASPKRAPAGVMGNEMAWAYPKTASGETADKPSMVGVVVVRAGFPRPSDFSR